MRGATTRTADTTDGLETRTRPDWHDKRQAILDAALVLFVERGFHGTAVPLVAQRAGVGAGTIYRYFHNKDALVNTLYREWKERITSFVMSEFPTSATPREQFHVVWERMTTFVRRHAMAYSFLELHHHASYLDKESRATERRAYDFATAFVLQAQASGVLRPGPPGTLLGLVHGAFVGLVRFAAEGRVKWTPEELEVAEQALWDLVAAPNPNKGA